MVKKIICGEKFFVKGHIGILYMYLKSWHCNKDQPTRIRYLVVHMI